LFELCDDDVLPGFARADEHDVHEIQHRTLAEGVQTAEPSAARKDRRKNPPLARS
jgi:hypothetical protein